MKVIHPLRIALLTVTLATAGATVATTDAHAQGMLGRMKKKAEDAAKRKVEERTEKRAGEATDAALDKAECAASDKACEERQKEAAANSGATSTATASAKARPGEGAWRNYDFVPGTRVILAEDFSKDNVGDFPKRFEFRSGNIEIVEWENARFLSTNTFGSEFVVPLPEQLPERFTLELDYSAAGGNAMAIYFTDPKAERLNYIDMGTWSGGIRGNGMDAMGKPAGDEYKYRDIVFPVKVMADGRHVKVYMGDTRVANVPNANLGRSKAIYFWVPGRTDRAAMIGNIRVSAGGKKLYDALAEAGRVATQGIFFDVGSDRIRPESTPTLKEIGQMLTEHADLSLTIEGHTDNVGDAKANMTLSEKRAAAVKAHLVSEYKVDESRLTSKGLGASKPAAPNTTAEGRQQNRRVELVKQ